MVTVLTLLVLVAMPGRMAATRRHQMLVVVVLLSLAAPLLQRVIPEWQVLPRPANPPRMIAAVTAAPSHEAAAQAAPAVVATTALQSASHTAATPAPNSWRTWFRVAAFVWLAGAVVGLLRLACQQAALSRCIRNSTAAPIAIEELATELLQRHVRVRLAVDTGDAFVCRIFSPVIVLPAAAVHLPHDQLRLILSHEVAHLRRLDPLWAWLMQCFLAIYWVHPLAWMLVKRSHLAREMATDDLVLLDGSDPEAYAACLGASALRHRRHAAPPLPALAFVRQHPVVARLHAILDANRIRTAPSGKGWLSVGLPLAAPALLLTSLAFKAAVEVQPVRQAHKRATAKAETTPSLWSDIVEPLVSDTPSESQVVNLTTDDTLAQSGPSTENSPAPSPLPSTTGSHPGAAPAPLREPTLAIRPSTAHREDSSHDAFTESSFSLPHTFGTGFAGRPGKRVSAPVSTPPAPIPTDTVANPGGSTPTPPAPTQPPVQEIPSPPDDTAIPGTDPKTPTDIAGETPTDEEWSDPASEGEEPPVREASSRPPGRDPAGSPSPDSEGVGSGEIHPPQPQISTYSSAEGSHFAISWIVSVEEAATWIPQASADLVTWSAAAEAVIVEGPFPAGDGAVRFTAAIREPMPGSFYRFLRLATPATEGGASSNSITEE